MGFKRSIGESIFTVFNTLFMYVIMFITVYPFLYVAFASLSDPGRITIHSGLLLYPLDFTLGAYKGAFNNPMILIGYRNTLFYVVFGTAYMVLMTSLGAYVLSRRGLYWGRLITLLCVFTMFFSGGMIPSYLIVKSLGMENTVFALIIPASISTFNMILMRTSFRTIPESLEQSAKIDGANDWTILFRIVLPLSMPIVAVMILFYGVGIWNSWFSAMLYLRNRTLYPLQLILREILIINNLDVMGFGVGNTERESYGMTIKYAIIMIASIPIMCVYPFLQKYFIRGIMVGAIKE